MEFILISQINIYSMINIKTYENFGNDVTFTDLYKAAKNNGQLLEGDERGFDVKYEHGHISLVPTSDGRVDVTWWSGGDSQDSDVYDIETAMEFVK
jgi:hypothetical protein